MKVRGFTICEGWSWSGFHPAQDEDYRQGAMRARYLQHVPFEGLGSIASWLAGHGCRTTAIRLFEDAAFTAINRLMGGVLAHLTGPPAGS